MDRIIPTCKAFGRVAIIAAALALVSTPALAAPESEKDLQRYVAARLAEIDDRSDDALKGYSGLFKSHSDSASLADRLFENAIRAGDMAAALRAVRALELRDQADGAAPMLLFADAFRRKDWANAELAAAELAAKSNYGFIAPLLKSWIQVAKGKPHRFKIEKPAEQALLGYYSTDQRVYLELAGGNYQEAAKKAREFQSIEGDYARNLKIRIAPVFAANGHGELATTLVRDLVERDYLHRLVKPKQSKKVGRFTAQEGVAAINARLAASLVEQKVPDQGLILARIAVWLDSDSDAAKATLATALLAGGLQDEARATLSAMKPASPHWPRSVSKQVRHLSDAGQGEAALALAHAALKQRPNSANLLLLIAQAQEQTKDYSAASSTYARLAEDARTAGIPPKQQALYLLFLATALDKDGKWAQARKHLTDARTLDPNNPYILNYLGYSLLERNEELVQALAFVKRAHRLAPKSAAIADSLGLAHYLNGEFEEAIGFLESAVKQSGNDLAINEHMGDAYWMAGRRIDARYAWKIAEQRADGEDAKRLEHKIGFGLPRNAHAPKTN